MVRMRAVPTDSERKIGPAKVIPPVSLFVRVLLLPELVKLPPEPLNVRAFAPPTDVLPVRKITLSTAWVPVVLIIEPLLSTREPVPSAPPETEVPERVSLALINVTPPPCLKVPENVFVPVKAKVPLPAVVMPPPAPLMVPPSVILPPAASVVMVDVPVNVIPSLIISRLVPRLLMVPLVEREKPLVPGVPGLMVNEDAPTEKVIPVNDEPDVK